MDIVDVGDRLVPDGFRLAIGSTYQQKTRTGGDHPRRCRFGPSHGPVPAGRAYEYAVFECRLAEYDPFLVTVCADRSHILASHRHDVEGPPDWRGQDGKLWSTGEPDDAVADPASLHRPRGKVRLGFADNSPPFAAGNVDLHLEFILARRGTKGRWVDDDGEHRASICFARRMDQMSHAFLAELANECESAARVDVPQPGPGGRCHSDCLDMF